MSHTFGGRHRWRLGVVLVGVLAGCGPLSSPPVAVAYRESLLGKGLVLIITNASPDKSLIHLGLRAKIPGDAARDVLLAPSLAPGATVEAGWLELRQRGDSSANESAIVPGTKVEIYARDYGVPVRLTVPETTR